MQQQDASVINQNVWKKIVNLI